MAVGTYAPDPFEQYFDNNGNPLNAGKIETYIAGTSTPVATYSDVGLTTPNANPIILDSAGRPSSGAIFLTPGVSYKFILKTSAGVTIATRDNIAAVPTSATTVDVTGTAGETITAGQAVYLSDGSGAKTPGQWYKADTTNTFSSTFPMIGMAPAAITSGTTGAIRLQGQVTGLSALTVGADYFLSTAGLITTSAPANKRFIGRADSTTSLVVGPANTPVLTAGMGIAVTNGTGIVTIKQIPAIVGLTDAATVALDASLGSVFRLLASGNRTIGTPTNFVDGKTIIIEHTAVGADRTLALSAAFAFGTDITALTLTTNTKTDYIGAVYNANSSLWHVVAYVKGY